MAELFPYTIEDQIACVERELRFRQYVYPRRIAQRKMTQQQADKEIALMSEVARSLADLKTRTIANDGTAKSRRAR